MFAKIHFLINFTIKIYVGVPYGTYRIKWEQIDFRIFWGKMFLNFFFLKIQICDRIQFFNNVSTYIPSWNLQKQSTHNIELISIQNMPLHIFNLFDLYVHTYLCMSVWIVWMKNHEKFVSFCFFNLKKNYLYTSIYQIK